MAKKLAPIVRTPNDPPLVISTIPGTNYVPVDEIARISEAGLGFNRVMNVSGSTYRDSSTIILIPTRYPKIDYRVVQAWDSLIGPMNQKKAKIIIVNDEVGGAYTQTIQNILANPELSKWKYVMTMETDNLPPPDAHIRLLETIEKYKFDGVSGIYFTKGEINMPMAYGDPDVYKQTGKLEFTPRDIRSALMHGRVMPVNGIAMGCSLYRMDVFRKVPPPWFVTVSDLVNGAPQGFTQDLYFCKNAVERGCTFGVDMAVKVGHLDENTGIVY